MSKCKYCTVDQEHTEYMKYQSYYASPGLAEIDGANCKFGDSLLEDSYCCIDLTNSRMVMEVGFNIESFKISNCPMCGRKLVK